MVEQFHWVAFRMCQTDICAESFALVDSFLVVARVVVMIILL